MRAEAEIAHKSGFSSLQKRLHRASRREDGVHLFGFRQGMQLVEVEMIGMKMAQRAMQLFPGSVRRALHSLAREKNVLPEAFQGRTEPFLRLLVPAIAGSDVEIVDSPLDRLSHDRIGFFLTHSYQHDAAQSQQRQLAPGTSQHTPLHRPLLFRESLQWVL